MNSIKKRLLSACLAVLMVVGLMPNSALAEEDGAAAGSAVQIGNYFEVDDKEGEIPSKAQLTGNTAQSYADGAVVVNKTISGTNEENVFDITLTVDTLEKIDSSSSSPDAAVVLVIDCSGSMEGDKMSNAKEAAQAFINGFVDDNAERKIAIVKFSGATARHGSIDGAYTVQSWTDASNLDTRNNNTFCTPISWLNAQGGTNIQAGLILAKNLLGSDDIKDIENKNIILLSDGQPTYGVNENEAKSTSTQVICEDGKQMTGTGYEDDTECEQHEPVEELVPVLKNAGVNTYAVYLGRSEVDCTECSLDKSGKNWLGEDCGFKAYSAEQIDTVVEIFEAILRLIELKAQAWVVTDPMGAGIDFVKFNQDPNPVNEFVEEDGKITWDIKSGSIPKVTTKDNTTIYTYTLSYRIKLDTLAEGYKAGVSYATNGVTGLTYLVAETVDGIESYENGTAYFNIPSVEGYAADLTFDKVGSFDESLSGAEFTLTKGEWSATAVAKDGKVTFEDVPSGHSFTLTETKVPNGYVDTEKEYNVTVSYGEITVDGASADNLVIKNQSETIDIEGIKTWIDGGNAEGTRPESIVIELLADGQKVDEATVSAANDWAYSFTDKPLYRGGAEIKYTVSEQKVAGYTSEVATEGYDITNTIKQDTVSITGTKTWIDPEGTVHPTITINLLRDREKVASVTLENGTTSYSFNNLDKYDLTDGHAYIYEVEEVSVAGYTSQKNGNDFVNTIAQEKINISGSKTWNDPEGTEHPVITINLLRDGIEIEEVQLKNGETTYKFENLDKYNLTDGHEYKYIITEDPVEGYISDKVGNDFINTIEPGQKTISGVKTWIDPVGTVHPEVTIILLQNNEQYATKTLANGVTEYSFDVPIYDAAGQPYVYEIAEATVEGYTSEVSNWNVTNTIKQDYVSVEGTKTWIAPEGTEFPVVTIQLLQDGVEYKAAELKDGKTSYSFTELPKYNLEDGHVYEYTVAEVPVEGYTSVQNGTSFINTIAQDYVSVEGTKTWIAPEGTEFPAVTINLLQDNVVIDYAVLENGVTTYSFNNLEKYDLEDGHEYVYAVEEVPVEGYTSKQDGTSFTNTIAQDYISVEGTKTWIDPEGTKHPEIVINLLQDGIEVAEVKLADGETEFVFNDLEKYDLEDGHEYEYTVEEDAVAGYSTVIEDYSIVNTIEQELIVVKGTKTWVAPEGTKLPEITINLLKNGEVIERLNLKNGETAFEFTDLEKYTFGEDGKVTENQYTITEDPVDEYISEIKGYDVINTYDPELTQFTVTKVWKDTDDKDQIRPDSITVKLLANGEDTGLTMTLSAKYDWKGTFAELPVYENGKAIEYTVEEVAVEGYTTTINGNAEEGFVITNSHAVTPDTGDHSNFGMYFALASVCFVGLIAMVVLKKKASKN